MHPVTIQKYQCEICGTLYGNARAAIECEKRPITHDDVEIGDVVLITGGEGEGRCLRVETKSVLSREWAGDLYWHTVSVSGPVLGSWGNRMLTFNQWERVSQSSATANES